MNIVILPSWFRLKSNMTHGSFFLEQAVAMANAGHNVSFIDASLIDTRRYFATERDIGIKHYVENGVEIYEYKTCGFIRNRKASLTISEYTRKVNKILKIILKNNPIDVIHAHSFYPSGIAAVKLGKKYGIPVVITEHSSTHIKDWLHLKGVYDYVKPTFDSADATACVSKYYSELLYNKYSLKQEPYVIGNVLNPMFQYAPQIKNKVFTFIIIARITKIKRINHIITAVSKLKSNGTDVFVHVAGDGALRASLEQQAKDLGVFENFKFHGNISREQVYDLLKKSNAVVHASVTETFGVVYTEALASGRPVVSAKNGGANELINDTNGILVEPDDPDSLAEGMKRMIDNFERYDCRAISETAISEFSEAAIASAYEKIYNDVIKNK